MPRAGAEGRARSGAASAARALGRTMAEASDVGALPGQTVVYRLGLDFRRPLLARFVVNTFFAAVLAFGVAVLHALAIVLCCLTGAVAACAGVGYVWQGRFATTVTSQGILARGYFN